MWFSLVLPECFEMCPPKVSSLLMPKANIQKMFALMVLKYSVYYTSHLKITELKADNGKPA